MRGAWVFAIVAAFIGLAGSAGAGATTPAVHWKPVPGLRWQVQLQGTVDVGVCSKPVTGGGCVRPNVYDIDLYTNDGTSLNTSAVKRIHARGARAVCYVDAGTWEQWRPDAARYPKRILGSSNGWPGERWIDIRATSVLVPILDARVAKCGKAGFDAVDFDNVDGYANTTGFPLTAREQLTFDKRLAGIAHAHGLSVGLKNDLGQAGALLGSFDFAVNEQCAAFHECNRYDGWTRAHRAVLEIEYTSPSAGACATAAARKLDQIYKQLALRATPWRPCR